MGKLYNVLAQRIAASIVGEIAGVEEAYCGLLSQIGRPINQPQLIDVKVRLSDPATLDALRPEIVVPARAHVERVSTLWREVMAGTVQFY